MKLLLLAQAATDADAVPRIELATTKVYHRFSWEMNFHGRKIIIEGRRCLRGLVAFLGLEIYEFCRSSSGKKGGESDSYLGALGLFL